MSIVKLLPEFFEQFSLVTHPKRTYSSSSLGATGSIYVYARRSSVEKEIEPLSAFNDSKFNDRNLTTVLNDIKELTSSNISEGILRYIDVAHSQSASARLNKVLTISRFTPDVRFSQNTVKKNIIKNLLIPYYRSVYPNFHYAYTNFNSLNFFTASSVPSNTALAYPNISSSQGTAQYTLTGGFTFDFYINPRYTTDSPHGQFQAGAILHLSSSYSLFLTTGSSKDINGYPDKFRIVLALSNSAGVHPANIDLTAANNSRTGGQNLLFASDDNSLLKNHWHHVAVRWGTSGQNLGTGSFVIDRVERGKFIIPSSSISPTGLSVDPSVLLVGNFWASSSLGSDRQSLLFNSTAAARDGLITLDSGLDPSYLPLTSPLNAEIHDLKIFDHYRNKDQIYSSSFGGPDSFEGLRFYLPPFFVKESPNRTFQGTYGGILQTPFFSKDGTTDTPFNAALSFGVNGHYINLENFTRDFVTKNYPRLINLTGSEITETSTVLTCNAFLYNTGSVRKRNATILPCDNGNFVPNFSLLASGSTDILTPESGTNHDRYVNDLRSLDFSLITLNNLVSTGTIFTGLTQESGSFAEELMGSDPNNLTAASGSTYTILQRTRDPSSNQIVCFDISNLYYGKRILPGSFVISETSFSGTNGKVGIQIKDNGLGSLYRANASGSHPTWSSVGNIFYSEGLVLIKSPHLALFGADGFRIEFSGESKIHTLKISAPAHSGLINSSSNPTYLSLSSSLNANDDDNNKFVYITTVNLHDDNLNIVGRTTLAQPVLKKESDKIVFKTKFDF